MGIKAIVYRPRYQGDCSIRKSLRDSWSIFWGVFGSIRCRYASSGGLPIRLHDRYYARNFGHVANFCTNIAGLISCLARTF